LQAHDRRLQRGSLHWTDSTQLTFYRLMFLSPRDGNNILKSRLLLNVVVLWVPRIFVSLYSRALLGRSFPSRISFGKSLNFASAPYRILISTRDIFDKIEQETFWKMESYQFQTLCLNIKLHCFITMEKYFASAFTCNDGTTISSKKFCDSVEDCDGSDEALYVNVSTISPFLR